MVAITLYTFVKFLHVLLAIVAVGFNASYGIWLTRARTDPANALHVLRGIKLLDDRFANPGYALLLITGVAMVLIGDISFATFWIATALVLYGVMAVVALAVYTPTLRKQIAVLESDGVDSEEYRRLSRRGAVIGPTLGVIVIAIVFLMVTKPTL